MNVESGTEAAQFLFWEHINGIFVALYTSLWDTHLGWHGASSRLLQPFITTLPLAVPLSRDLWPLVGSGPLAAAATTAPAATAGGAAVGTTPTSTPTSLSQSAKHTEIKLKLNS
jgi:hypothetical protein